MYYKTEKPAKELQNTIERYWIIEGKYEIIMREIAPSSNIVVCYNFGANASYCVLTKDTIKELPQQLPEFVNKIESLSTTYQQVIIGPHKETMVETSHKHIKTIAIEFKTGYRNTFFGLSIKTLSGNVIPIDYDNKIISDLGELLSNTKTEDIFQTIDKYLIDNYLTSIYSTITNNDLFESINYIKDNPFNQKALIMAEENNKCLRHFNRIFKEYTGLASKQFIMIQKINKVIETMIVQHSLSLKEIIELCGYYDHSQLNRDFKLLGGITATKAFNNIRENLAFMPSPMGYKCLDDKTCGINLL